MTRTKHRNLKAQSCCVKRLQRIKEVLRAFVVFPAMIPRNAQRGSTFTLLGCYEARQSRRNIHRKRENRGLAEDDMCCTLQRPSHTRASIMLQQAG